MTILVLDTNALGKGHYSAAALRKLVNLAGPTAQAVVPEVVIWEWAEHLRSAYLAVGEALRAIQIETDILDRPKLDPVKTLEELIADIERSVEKSASIWRPPVELWRGALREQVLQVKSGEKKSGVKTGAADAVVLACVEAQLEASEELIVLLSGDERLRRNVKTLGHVVLARGHGDLLQAINSFVPATEELISQLDEQLVSFLNARVSSLVSQEYGVGVHFGPGFEPWHPSAILSSIDVSHVTDAEVLGLEVEEGDGERVGVGQLRLLGKMKGTILDRDVSGALGASDFEVDFSHEYLDVPVSITWDQDWMIEDVYPTGTAVLVLYNPEAEVPDGYDAGEFRAKAGV